MAENPDRQAGDLGKFAPKAGDLRFVLRQIGASQLRILQRYEWSYAKKKCDWYDIHLAKED